MQCLRCGALGGGQTSKWFADLFPYRGASRRCIGGRLKHTTAVSSPQHSVHQTAGPSGSAGTCGARRSMGAFLDRPLVRPHHTVVFPKGARCWFRQVRSSHDRGFLPAGRLIRGGVQRPSPHPKSRLGKLSIVMRSGSFRRRWPSAWDAIAWRAPCVDTRGVHRSCWPPAVDRRLCPQPVVGSLGRRRQCRRKAVCGDICRPQHVARSSLLIQTALRVGHSGHCVCRNFFSSCLDTRCLVSQLFLFLVRQSVCPWLRRNFLLSCLDSPPRRNFPPVRCDTGLPHRSPSTLASDGLQCQAWGFGEAASTPPRRTPPLGGAPVGQRIPPAFGGR